MADMKWDDPIRKSGILNVYADGTVTGGWAGVMAAAVKEFNALMAAKSVKLKLVQSTEKRSANIFIALAHGKSDTAVGEVSLDGSGLHAFNRPVADSASGLIIESYIFLPNKPMTGQTKGAREVGQPVKLFMLVHELIHAAGVRGHTTDDVMCWPKLQEGAKPQDDRCVGALVTGEDPKTKKTLHKEIVMPPLLMNGDTTRKLAELWK
jgi:hypothetical protein